MLNPHTDRERPAHVLVEFGDGAHSFLLPQGASFEELVDRIEELTALHKGAPVAVHVGFDKSNVPRVRTAVPRGPSPPH